MKKDPTEFRQRFAAWKNGEKVYKDGLPAYRGGKGSGKINYSRWDNAELTSYPVPFIDEKRITLTNAGRATGAVLSTNLLDSIADNANRAGLPLLTALGLAVKESTLGNPTDDRTAWNLSSGIRQAFNNKYPGTELHINYWGDALNEREDVINYHKGHLSDDPASGHKSVLLEAFEFYKQHPDKYNAGQKDYQTSVDKRGVEVMQSPEVKRWRNAYNTKRAVRQWTKPHLLLKESRFNKPAYKDGKVPGYYLGKEGDNVEELIKRRLEQQSDATTVQRQEPVQPIKRNFVAEAQRKHAAEAVGPDTRSSYQRKQSLAAKLYANRQYQKAKDDAKRAEGMELLMKTISPSTYVEAATGLDLGTAGRLATDAVIFGVPGLIKRGISSIAKGVANYRYPLGRPLVPENFLTVKPQIRTKIGDVEIDNPGLYYHQSDAGKAKNFVSTGRMRTPLEEYWLAKEEAGEKIPFVIRSGAKPGYPQSPGSAMFAQGNLWYDKLDGIRINPKKPDLLVTAKEMPISNKNASVMSNKASLRALEAQGTRRVTNDNIYTQGPHNRQNTTAYTWEPGYGYRKVFAEESPAAEWQGGEKVYEAGLPKYEDGVEAVRVGDYNVYPSAIGASELNVTTPEVVVTGKDRRPLYLRYAAERSTYDPNIIRNFTDWLPVVGDIGTGIDIKDAIQGKNYLLAGMLGGMMFLPAGLTKGVRKLSTPFKKLFKNNKAEFIQQPEFLDWSGWSWGGPISKDHLNEYLAIEKLAKQNGTFLKMPDGSLWDGDPHTWVLLMSKDGLKLSTKRYFHGNTDVYTSSEGQDVTPEILGRKSIWLSSNPNVARTYTNSDNKIYEFGIPKDIKIYSHDAQGRHWRAIMQDKNGSWLNTNNVAARSLYKDGMVEIKNVEDPGPSLFLKDSKYHVLPTKDETNLPVWQFSKLHFTGDDVVTNGHSIKSLLHNNGDFDLSNPNIYRMITPVVGAGVGYGLYNKYAE